MKLLSKLLLITLLSYLSCQVMNQLGSPQPARKISSNLIVRDTNGVSSTIKGAPSSEAVSYGLGSNGGYVIKDESEYLKPEIVTKLGNYKMQLGGAKVVAEEVIIYLK
jgi:hypothetical protein